MSNLNLHKKLVAWVQNRNLATLPLHIANRLFELVIGTQSTPLQRVKLPVYSERQNAAYSVTLPISSDFDHSSELTQTLTALQNADCGFQIRLNATQFEGSYNVMPGQCLFVSNQPISEFFLSDFIDRHRIPFIATVNNQTPSLVRRGGGLKDRFEFTEFYDEKTKKYYYSLTFYCDVCDAMGATKVVTCAEVLGNYIKTHLERALQNPEYAIHIRNPGNILSNFTAGVREGKASIILPGAFFPDETAKTTFLEKWAQVKSSPEACFEFNQHLLEVLVGFSDATGNDWRGLIADITKAKGNSPLLKVTHDCLDNIEIEVTLPLALGAASRNISQIPWAKQNLALIAEGKSQLPEPRVTSPDLSEYAAALALVLGISLLNTSEQPQAEFKEFPDTMTSIFLSPVTRLSPDPRLTPQERLQAIFDRIMGAPDSDIPPHITAIQSERTTPDTTTLPLSMVMGMPLGTIHIDGTEHPLSGTSVNLVGEHEEASIFGGLNRGAKVLTSHPQETEIIVLLDHYKSVTTFKLPAETVAVQNQETGQSWDGNTVAQGIEHLSIWAQNNRLRQTTSDKGCANALTFLKALKMNVSRVEHELHAKQGSSSLVSWTYHQETGELEGRCEIILSKKCFNFDKMPQAILDLFGLQSETPEDFVIALLTLIPTCMGLANNASLRMQCTKGISRGHGSFHDAHTQSAASAST